MYNEYEVMPELPEGWRMLSAYEKKQKGDKFWVSVGNRWAKCTHFGDMAGSLNWCIRRKNAKSVDDIKGGLSIKERVAKYLKKIA